jgi:hypothetical protein
MYLNPYVVNPTNSQGLDLSYLFRMPLNGVNEWDNHTSRNLVVDTYTVDSSAKWDFKHVFQAPRASSGFLTSLRPDFHVSVCIRAICVHPRNPCASAQSVCYLMIFLLTGDACENVRFIYPLLRSSPPKYICCAAL